MVNIIDVLIILFLGMGLFVGYKRGAIGMLVSLISTILIFYLAYYFRKPLATVLYTNMPAINLGSGFENVFSINILFYNVVAFVILFVILSAIFGIVIKVGNLFSKIVDHSIVLTLPSKLIGMLIGVLEAYIFCFIFILVFSSIGFSNSYINSSKLTNVILSKTPLTSDFTNIHTAFKKINDMKGNENLNNESLDILKKYNIIDSKMIDKLIKDGKIDIEAKGDENDKILE